MLYKTQIQISGAKIWIEVDSGDVNRDLSTARGAESVIRGMFEDQHLDDAIDLKNYRPRTVTEDLYGS